MGGIHFTMNEEELLMERERKVEESYKDYFDSRPGMSEEIDELYILLDEGKITLEELRKRALEIGKKYD